MARRGRLILIVDPDLDFVEDTRLLLSGERLLTARSLEEAEEIAVGGRVAAAVLGPSFGNEAGVRAAGILLAADPALHLVLVANVVTNRVLLAALQTGFADVVDTPLTLRKLLAALAPRANGEAAAAAAPPPAAADLATAPALAPAPGPEVAAVAAGAAAGEPPAFAPAAAFAAPPAAPAVVAPPVPSVAAVPAAVLPEPATAAPLVLPEPLAAAAELPPAPAPEPVAPAALEPAALPPVPVVMIPAAPIPPPAAFAPEVAAETLVAAAGLSGTPSAPSTDGVAASTPALEAGAAPPLLSFSTEPLPPPFPPRPLGAPPFPALPEAAALPDALEDAAEPAAVLEPPAVAPPLPVPAGEPAAPRAPLSGESRVILVMAGKGGSGKSVVATNLAVALTFAAGEDAVAIVDADLQFGDVALLLQMDPVRNLAEVARQVDDLSEARLDALLLHHECGLRVLPAPLQPAAADSVPPKAVVQVVDKLRRLYRYVVVDTGPVLDDVLLTLLDQADDVVVVVDMDLPSVKNAKIALDILRAGGYPMDRMRLVVNRINSKARLDLVELERSLGLRTAAAIPSDRLVPQSVNEGVPVVALSPRSRVARSFTKLARLFLPGDGRRSS